MHKTMFTKSPSVHVIRYTMVSEEPITEEIARKEQERLGYHPWGYGFDNFTTHQENGDLYEATWTSSDSCD